MNKYDLPELNLDAPIFVIYFKTGNLSKHRAEEMIGELHARFSYKNATTWIVPSDETKIDLLWSGNKSTNGEDKENIKFLSKKLNEIILLISNGTSDDALKSKIRDLCINELLLH